MSDVIKLLEQQGEEIHARLDDIEKKAGRPRPGAGGAFSSKEDLEHRKGFDAYIRRGDESILRKTMTSVSGPDGGFGVPKEIDAMIDALAVNVSPIRAIAKVQKISTQDFHKLVNVHGTGSAWVGETAARPATNTPQFADIVPPMGELYANPQVSQVMLDDAFFNIEQWLAEELSLEFSRAEGAAFVNGTGVTQPRGFLTYTNVATADATRAFGQLEYIGTGSAGAFKTTSASVNPSDDLITLVSKLKAIYRGDARWVMNKKTLFAIMGFKDSAGRYIFNPTTAPGIEDTILGYPVTESEDMPDYTTASAYAIAFGNFQRAYLIVDRMGTRVIRDPYTNKPYVSYYTTKRVGGAVINSEAIKLLKFV